MSAATAAGARPAELPGSVGEVGLFLDGLRCAGCVNRTERALRAEAGVRAAHVNYTTHRALLRYDTGETSVERLVAAVEALGYRARPYDPAALDRPAASEAREALVRLLVAAFLAANVMWIAIALYAGSYQGMEEDTRRALRWLSVALSVPAISYCAAPFWRGALAGLRRRELTLDVPVVLGVSTSFAASIAGTLGETHHLFADSASMIVFLVLLGRTLERGARAKAASAVERLAALAPAVALRRRADGGTEEVPAAELAPGDRVVVPAGQTIPADGTLLGHATEVDESTFTGESLPALRAPGDSLLGGSRNLLVEAEMQVTAALHAGALARLSALLERAQAERPRVQRLVDRVAGYFAPTVLSIAALTALAWTLAGAAPLDIALTTAAVLIVACPCALGLATPAAVTAALGRAAELGVLVKSGEALERCARVTAVVFDKTGTLTAGAFRVEALATAGGASEEELLATALTAEGASTHPVAEAIRRAAAARGVAPAPTPEGVRRVVAGRGVVLGEGGDALRVGSRELVQESGAPLPPELEEAAARLAARGLSLAFVAQGSRHLGLLGLLDPPREDAAAAAERMAELGLDVSLVTGDHAGAADAVASRCGLVHVMAGASPDDKVARVRELRAGGARVLAVGDGINDAAALGAADVGVAMSEGSDVTLHAADVVIRSPRLLAVTDVVALSRSAFSRIRENLGLALLYNAVAVPLAVAGWLDPLKAAIFMSLSSVVVTANGVRLLSWRPRR